jgi:cytochrome P450
VRDGVIDLDHHDPRFLEHRLEQLGHLRRACPVAWNQHYGGYWLVTDYESVAAVARDNDTFAHRYEPGAADGIDYQGIAGVPRPRSVPRQGVAEQDGPVHFDLRRVMHPFLSPQEVERNRPRVQEVCDRFLDDVVESGECDLVHDFATPVPAVLTLDMLGMPTENWKHWADFFHAATSYRHDEPEFLAAMSRWQDMRDELMAFVQLRRAEPSEDLTTAILTNEMGGDHLDDVTACDVLWNLVAGGVDTTTSLVSWGLHHLGTHPEDRAALLADPAAVPTAVEELLRHHCPNEAMTRTATRDVELGGRQVRRGDVVLISWLAANHDEAQFESPDTVDIGRQVNRHLSFGLGGHRCIGSHLARSMSETMLCSVLDRMPDYEVDGARFSPNPPRLLMSGVRAMPVSFTPGPRRGAPRDPPSTA